MRWADLEAGDVVTSQGGDAIWLMTSVEEGSAGWLNLMKALKERQERVTSPAGPMALRRGSGTQAAYRASAYSQVVPKISCDVVRLRRKA